MRRRELIALAGSAAAMAASWPLAARAQQSATPVIGFLSTRSFGGSTNVLDAFRAGLGESGYVEGRNVTIEYRFAENQPDRLPTLAADLVRRQVSVIAAAPTNAAFAAQASSSTIPVVFYAVVDPVATGLVASLNRPGGNLTGITTLGVELEPKRLELLHEVVPSATTVALLLNPTNSVVAETLSRETQAAARTLGLQLHILHASTEHEIDTAFASLPGLKAGGLVIGPDAFFNTRSEQLAALTLRHMMPAAYQYRAFTAAGGLMSYGGSLTDMYRQVGVYTGRILKGEKPAELPVQQSTKAELYLNLKTAKTLGVTVPLPLLGRADEVIE
jgi:putative ABC transport system substrate-binding protein